MVKKSIVEKIPSITIPKEITTALESISKLFGVAVSELWEIFVRQYIVRGLSEIFIGIVLVGLSIYLEQYIHLFNLILVGISLPFFFDSIQMLGNPKYYALEDITDRVKKLTSNEKEKKISRNDFYY